MNCQGPRRIKGKLSPLTMGIHIEFTRALLSHSGMGSRSTFHNKLSICALLTVVLYRGCSNILSLLIMYLTCWQLWCMIRFQWTPFLGKRIIIPSRVLRIKNHMCWILTIILLLHAIIPTRYIFSSITLTHIFNKRLSCYRSMSKLRWLNIRRLPYIVSNNTKSPLYYVRSGKKLPCPSAVLWLYAWYHCPVKGSYFHPG